MKRSLTALMLALLLSLGFGLAAAEDDDAAAAPAKRPAVGVAALAGDDFAKAFDKVRALLKPYLAEKAEKKEKKRVSRRKRGKAADDDGDDSEAAADSGNAQRMASAIEAARAASVPAKAASFKSLFLACATQGLAGLKQAESGSRKEAAEGQRKLHLCADDVENMALAAGEPVKGQAMADTGKRPKNIGINLMLGGYQDYVAGSLGVSVGVPMGKMLENGGGVTLGFTNQANSGNGNNFMFNIGLDAYSHVNFYNAFGTPNIVPYVGGHGSINLNLGFGYTYDGASSSDQTGYSVALGPQAGLLIFMSKDVALNLGLGVDYSVLGNSNDNYDSSGNVTSNSSSNNGLQLVANLGLRFSL
jgi:hypothetical protein